jgi:radical SAM superfamily enzyme YgiQ (UPF0313 family)
MKYEGRIIRPPSEARSLLLQATVGCSHNQCTFCASYKQKRFRIKTSEEIEEDIREAGATLRSVERVFLCDGDALIIPQRRLLQVLQSIREHIHGVQGVGTYANAKSILRKNREDLAELRAAGLQIVYLGVETGSEEVLQRIRKGATYEKIVEAGRRVKQAGIKLSVTALLGIGGVELSEEHARATARILTDLDPEYAGMLTVMVVPGTPLYENFRSGAFVLPGTFDLLRELRIIIAASSFTDCFFTSNHASNYLPVRARLPGDQKKVLALLDGVIHKERRDLLRPEYLRGL